MSERAITLDVTILGREYRVACKESERAELLESVKYLDRRMREIRDAGKIAGAERIAVMAALNISNEMLRIKASAASVPAAPAFDSAPIERRISSMQAAIERAMKGQETSA
jgi:cell division protein ZapA